MDGVLRGGGESDEEYDGNDMHGRGGVGGLGGAVSTGVGGVGGCFGLPMATSYDACCNDSSERHRQTAATDGGMLRVRGGAGSLGRELRADGATFASIGELVELVRGGALTGDSRVMIVGAGVGTVAQALRAVAATSVALYMSPTAESLDFITLLSMRRLAVTYVPRSMHRF